jgi:sec-independent protein translocase protein TatB
MGPSFADTIFLFLLALIIFGPKRLPEIGRQIGKVMNELKRASNEFKAQIQTEMDQMERQENNKKILEPSAPPAGAIASLPLPPAPPQAEEPAPVVDLNPIADPETPATDSSESTFKVTNV